MARKAEPGRREAILAVARDLFKRQGYDRTSMAQISRQSGVAYGTVYLYFRSKLELADALCENYLEGVADILYRGIQFPVTPEAIRRTIHDVLLYAAEIADEIRLLDLRMDLGLEYLRPQADRKLQSILRNKFKEGMRSGQIREYDPLTLAEMVGGLIEWITKVCFVRGHCDARRFEETAARMLEFALLDSQQ